MRLGLIHGNTDNPHNDKTKALEMLNLALKIRIKKYGPDHKQVKETEHAIHAIEHPEEFAKAWAAEEETDAEIKRKKAAILKPIAAATSYCDRTFPFR